MNDWHIRKVPDPVLSRVCEPVESVTLEIQRLAKFMSGLVGVSAGRVTYIGVAAPQVGEPVRLICLLWGNEVITLANPVIISASEKLVKSYEGCLSVPGYYTIMRPEKVKVRGLRLDLGHEVTMKVRGIDAFVMCHEIDHLDGITIDRK